MTELELFPRQRVCVACERSTGVGKHNPREPNIVAISLVLYRRGTGKAQLKAAGKVHICERCLALAIAPSIFQTGEAKRLFAGLRERISARYSAMLEEEGK